MYLVYKYRFLKGIQTTSYNKENSCIYKHYNLLFIVINPIMFHAKTCQTCTYACLMDRLHYRLNFDLNKSRQKFHHSLKEHHKISNMLGVGAVNFPFVIQND